MNIEELIEKVKQWSEERGILEHSTYEKQIEKLFSERAEIFTTDDLEDSYGDQMVCLINAGLLHDGRKIFGVEPKSFMSLMERELCVGPFEAMHGLELQILDAGLEPEVCFEKAWDAIKHRVGLMIGGKFVKWDNLTHEQCIEVAESGQLMKPDVDLDHCKSFCTEEQWWQIREAERLTHDL
jgi:hypothetical protein